MWSPLRLEKMAQPPDLDGLGEEFYIRNALTPLQVILYQVYVGNVSACANPPLGQLKGKRHSINIKGQICTSLLFRIRQPNHVGGST